MTCHSLSSIALDCLALGFGLTPSHNIMNVSHSSMPAVRCVHGMMEGFPMQVTIGGLNAGTQYIVTVNVMLMGDHPGPKATLVISTTSKLVHAC